MLFCSLKSLFKLWGYVGKGGNLHEYWTEHFVYLISIQEELDDIIRYGSKELFADENDEAGKSRQIHYDDAAIDR